MLKQWQRNTRKGARLFAGTLVVGLAVASGSAAAGLSSVGNFGSNPGNLLAYKYVPSGLPSNAPLVVAMHGCTQTASAYHTGAGWRKLANEHGFAVLYPEQQSSNNQNACFNWFENQHINRGQGEALSIRNMVNKVINDHGLDSSRVYATGLSAGGAMTNVMLATYPDVFAGGAPIAGIPYKCATSMTEAFSCMSPGVTKSAGAWGDLVRNASSHNGPWPKVSVWHGTADYIVVEANLTETVKQWTNVHGTNQSANESGSVKGYPQRGYANGSGIVVEDYRITGMGHGTPVDPGNGSDQCGQAGAYILDEGICSSYFIASFFGIADGSYEPDDPIDPDEPKGPGEWSGCGADTNANHTLAGRTEVISGTYFYAKGSWNWMGASGDIVTTLKETSPGFFQVVSSC